MNDQDIRVIKTREDIASAFYELLQKKPMSSIVVTELCRTARIHKSTFYRHYLDIRDLRNKIMMTVFSDTLNGIGSYTDFFDAPERFLTELEQSFRNNSPKALLLTRGEEHIFFVQLLELFSKKIYETGRLEKNAETDMRLDIVLIAMLKDVSKYADGQREQYFALITSLIRFLFPETGAAAEG